MRILFLCLLGTGFGMLASAGIFNIFVAIGLVPRFAGKTHTASKVILYEEMVVLGTLVGGFISLYPEYCQFAAWWQQRFLSDAVGVSASYGLSWMPDLFACLAIIIQVVFGLFSGMFVGCLALAIAEMLDSFPILARRVSFRHGLGFAILSMAFGKIFGSIWYFAAEIYKTIE